MLVTGLIRKQNNMYTEPTKKTETYLPCAFSSTATVSNLIEHFYKKYILFICS